MHLSLETATLNQFTMILDITYLASSLTETKPHTAITNHYEKVRRKDSGRMQYMYKESNLEEQNFEEQL